MSELEFQIIANPTSGRKGAPDLAQQILQRLTAAGRKAELTLTKAAGDARKLSAEAVRNGVPIVVGCGGDGTLQEIASSLVNTSTALAILPGGRCNDLALAIKITKKDSIESLLDMILKRKSSKMDLGRFEALDASGKAISDSERIFCTVATMGFDTHVSRFVEQNKLPVRGTMAYLYGVVRIISKFEPIPVVFKGDFGVYEQKIILAATGNTATYGGAMQIAPNASPMDGQFDICVVGEISKTTLLRFLPKVYSGKHINHPSVRVLKTKSIEIQTPQEPQWICADGETLGQTPARLTVLSNSLNVIIK